MIINFLLAILTGILWTGVAIVFSVAARRKTDLIAFMAASSMISTVLAWIFFPDYQVLTSGQAVRLLELAAIMFCSAFFSVFGMLLLQQSMRKGHQAVSWAIGQSALVFPFLCGILFLNDPVKKTKLSGVVAVLISFIMYGYTKRKANNHSNTDKSSKQSWLALELLAFCAIGIQQCFSMIPSYWSGWTDAARMRIPLGATAGCIGYLVLMLITKRFPTKQVIVIAVMLPVFSLAGQFTFFKAMDRFAAVRLGSIVYPLAIGVNITGFALYSLLVIREKATVFHGIGLSLGLLGIVLLSL